MTAFLYLGGEADLSRVEEFPGEGDLVIAADGGYRTALAHGVTPTLVVGDFDSFREDELPAELERIRVPAEKDFTDAELAVRVALERGATAIRMIGGLGGRLDHTCGAICLLEALWEKGIRNALIDSGHDRVRYLKNDSALLPRSGFRYLSVLAVDPRVRGFEIRGTKYEVKKPRDLLRTAPLGVSNEITGNCAFLAVRRGAVLVIESGRRE